MYLLKSLPFFFWLVSYLPTLNCFVIIWAAFGSFGGGFFWRFHVYISHIICVFFFLSFGVRFLQLGLFSFGS